MEILFWVAVLTWMAKRSAEDVAYAVKGKPNPRYELKKQKALAAGRMVPQQPRYGGREWFADLLSDAMVANTEKRRKAAKAKAQPVDDMVDVVRESRPAPGRGTRRGLCPTCLRTELPVGGGPCPTCEAWRAINADTARMLGEYDRRRAEPATEPTSVVHDDQHPYCLEPCGPTCGQFGWVCGSCGTEKKHFASRYEAEKAHRAHICPKPERQPTTEEVPVGFPYPTLSQTATEPTARIYQFPNIKKIEKEIAMPNSEVTGLATAIAYANEVAETHQSFNTEGYAGALSQLGFGETILGLEAEAREASTVATAKWTALAEAMEQFQSGREFYQSNPDAPEKAALVNE